MAEQVRVKRTTLPAPSIDDPERKVIQIQYQVGELPPHFVYIAAKDHTPEKEKELIKADIKKRTAATTETVEL